MPEIQSVSEVPGVLAGPYAGRKSGFLHFHRSHERRSVCFHRGSIVYAFTNVVEHRLGETLVRHGRLSAEDLAAASEVLRRRGGRLGAALLAKGFLDEAQLVEALEVHTRTVIEPLFTWQSGGYEFAPHGASASVAPRPPDVMTVDLIAAATRRLEELAAVWAAVPHLDRPLVHGDPTGGARSLSLTDHEAAALRLVDGGRTVQDIVALRPQAAGETLRGLLTLLCTGLVKWLPGGSRTSAEAVSVESPLLAEMREAFARAETLVAIERYWDAIQLLEPIRRRVSDPVLSQATRVLLARAYLNNPLWVRRAEDLLRAVVAENPKNADALLLLGQLYRSQGLRHRAEGMLRRVLELRPGHRSAAAELTALGTGRRPKTQG